MKKRVLKCFCTVLCLIMVFTSLPISAQASGFVSFKTVQTIGTVRKTTEEIGYSDGNYLYVNVDFLTRYIPYVFDEGTSSFIRVNHDKNSYYGRVTIDTSSKNACLYMNYFAKKEYTLHDVFTFGNELYLPLDQMAALLKAELIEETDEYGNKLIVIGCCMNSLSDAEFALSKLTNSKKYVYYGYDTMIDDIFFGNEWLYNASSVKGYVSSTIFGGQIKNLDVITNSGKVDQYEDFISKCILDNEDYLKATMDTESLCYRFSSLIDFADPVGGASKDLSEYLSYIHEIVEPYKNISLDKAMLYIDTEEWGTLFDYVSQAIEWADYTMKFGSMNQDNKNMINDFTAYSSKHKKSDVQLYKAVTGVNDKFGNNYVSGAVANLLENCEDWIVKQGSKELLKMAFSQVETIDVAIKAINLVTQACGIDLTDNTGYSILLEMNAKSAFANYYDTFSDNHYQNKSVTEKYRLASLLWLLSSKQVLKTANKLNQNHGGSDSMYDNRIEVISTAIGMFYLAAQGNLFDNYESIDSVISDNRQVIQASGVLSNYNGYTEDEVSNRNKESYVYPYGNEPSEYTQPTSGTSIYPGQQPTVPTATGWEASAQELIYNYYRYNSQMAYNDGFFFYLVDVDSDGVPEIYEGAWGGTGRFTISDFFYYSNGMYTKGVIDTDNSCIYDISPYVNKSTSTIEFWESVLPDDLSKDTMGLYNYEKCNRISLQNGTIRYAESLDRSAYTNVLSDPYTYSYNQINSAFDSLKAEKDKFNSEHEYAGTIKYTYKSFDSTYFINEGDSLQTYHKIVPESAAEKIVSDYVNNAVSGHFTSNGVYR